MAELKRFPEGFYWGAATASYQVEGGIENTDWAKAAREGRVPEAGRSSDHFHRFKEDFDIAKSLGHTAHRFSIEWARIEPKEGKFDDEAIKHYRAVLMALQERNIRPFITLWHFTLPLWFSERGGFVREDSPQIFARYCAHVVKELSDLCNDFSTMNEPMVFSTNGYLRGTWPPFMRFVATDLIAITNSGKSYEPNSEKGLKPILVFFKVRKNLARAHNAAYDAIKAVAPQSEVSVVKHVILFHANWNPINMFIARIANWQWTHRFMKRVYKKCDCIGLNYYFHKKYGDKNEYEKTDMDWDIYPEGIYNSLMMLKRYKKPLFVSEAGIADEADVHRADYITRQVRATLRAIKNGADVRGHMYWSLLDNYEWALGYEKRFGLVEIDYQTLERKIRPSAYVYKEICESNAVE